MALLALLTWWRRESVPSQVVLQVVLRTTKVVLRRKRPARSELLTGRYYLTYLEREKGFEPSTSTLARSHSTAELLPQSARISSLGLFECQAELTLEDSASAE